MMTSFVFLRRRMFGINLKEKPMDTVELAITVEVVFSEQTTNQPIGYNNWTFNFLQNKFPFFQNTVDERNPKQPPGMYQTL